MKAYLQNVIRKHAPKSLVEKLVFMKQSASRLPTYKHYVAQVSGKRGLEIGGPSMIFKTRLPLYQHILELDGVNFSNQTVWEGKLAAGRNFSWYSSRKGFQYISEASDLSCIENQTYDFLLSSNCLEHIANPVKALLEWKRVIRNGGTLVLVLPNKLNNFDHQRPTTPFSHLLEDFEKGTTEHDLTHLDEILALHDLARDPPAGDMAQFNSRSLHNFHNRTLHHHVFDLQVMREMLAYAGFEVIETTETPSDYFALAWAPSNLVPQMESKKSSP